MSARNGCSDFPPLSRHNDGTKAITQFAKTIILYHILYKTQVAIKISFDWRPTLIKFTDVSLTQKIFTVEWTKKIYCDTILRYSILKNPTRKLRDKIWKSDEK